MSSLMTTIVPICSVSSTMAPAKHRSDPEVRVVLSLCEFSHLRLGDNDETTASKSVLRLMAAVTKLCYKKGNFALWLLSKQCLTRLILRHEFMRPQPYQYAVCLQPWHQLSVDLLLKYALCWASRSVNYLISDNETVMIQLLPSQCWDVWLLSQSCWWGGTQAME